MRLIYVCNRLHCSLLLSLIAFAEKVEVTNIEDNKNGAYQATELEEKGKFFHDRDYTITNIPKDFLGLTQVSTSADCPGGQDYRLTFEIDRSRLMSIKHGIADINVRKTADKNRRVGLQRDTRIQKKTLVLDAPHPPVEYFIYKSNEPLPRRRSRVARH